MEGRDRDIDGSRGEIIVMRKTETETKQMGANVVMRGRKYRDRDERNGGKCSDERNIEIETNRREYVQILKGGMGKRDKRRGLERG